MNITTLSRRRLLANSMPAIAAAAAMAPAAAAAICRLPAEGDDPMIHAVARHRQAWEAHEAVWLHVSKTEDEYGSERPASIFLYEYDETEGDTLKNNDDEFHIQWKKTGQKKPVFADCEDDIRRNATGLKELRGETKTAEREAWIASKVKELKAAKEAQEERTKLTPVGIALQAAHEARPALDEAAEELLNTSATTVAGVAAVLEHLAELSQAEALDQLFADFEDEDELRADFMRGLAETLRAVA